MGSRLRGGWIAPGAAALLFVAACTTGEADPSPSSGEPAAILGWSRLPNAPFARSAAVSLWTGRDLFYWGGETYPSAARHNDGALYDPRARRWRRVPPAPITGRSFAAAAWTGTEVVVWGGEGASDAADGAAYDPAARTWRRLASAPLPARVPAAALWTGRELIVWGSASRFAAARNGAAYDPRADRWRPIAPAPLALNQADAVWAGREMIVFGSLLDGNNASRSGNARGIAYSPATNRWRLLPGYPLSPQASSVAWTNAGLVAWDYLLRAGLYDPVADRWSAVNRLPLDAGECYPESVTLSGHVFAWYCGQAALYDLAQRRWEPLDPPRALEGGPAVAAGEGRVFLGPTADGEFWVYGPRSSLATVVTVASSGSGVSLQAPAGWSSRTNGADFVNPRLCYELSSDERGGPVRVHGSSVTPGEAEIRIVELFDGPTGPDTRPPRITLARMQPAGAVEWSRGSIYSFRENNRWIYLGVNLGRGVSVEIRAAVERVVNSIEVAVHGRC